MPPVWGQSTIEAMLACVISKLSQRTISKLQFPSPRGMQKLMPSPGFPQECLRQQMPGFLGATMLILALMQHLALEAVVVGWPLQ